MAQSPASSSQSRGVSVCLGFSDAERDRAAVLIWEAFEAKLHRALQPDATARRFVAKYLNPDVALSARVTTGAMLGLAGFKTQGGAVMGGTLRGLAQVHGWPGAFWRGSLLSLLERPVDPGTLLMDGICVAAEARGHQGRGTASWT